MVMLLRCRCIALTLSVFSAALAAQTPALSNPYPFDPQLAAVDAMAVLPFENRSKRPESTPFAAELYDEVFERLAALSGMHLVAPEAMFGYADTSLAPSEIARELSVDGIVEATIEDSGPQELLITVYYHIDNRSSGSTGFHRRDEQDAASVAASIVRSLALWIEPRSAFAGDDWMAQRIADAKVIILDARRSDAERLRGLYMLPNGPGMRGVPLAVEAKGGAVAIAAAQLATRSDDPKVRADVWRLMSGVGDPTLLEPLLYSLANDPDHSVRGEAARTLYDFVEQPGVRAALEHARDNDPTIRVRNESRLALLPDDEWSAMLQGVALDTELSEFDRASILVKFYDRADESRIVPGDFAVTMWQLARESDDERVREFVWSFLRRIDDAAMVEPLLDALAHDSDPRVRGEAARRLQRFSDRPDVSAALENAQATDESRAVRRQASAGF